MTEPFRIVVQYKERRLAIIIDPRNKQGIKILLDPIFDLQVPY